MNSAEEGSPQRNSLASSLFLPPTFAATHSPTHLPAHPP